MDKRLDNTNTVKTLWRKISKRIFGCVSLYTDKPLKGVALISYLTEPFLRMPNEELSPIHSSYAECREMAKILLDLGYNVDVIQWNNASFIPKKKYSLIIDTQQNLERLSTYAPKSCKKIFHTVGSYWKFQNETERTRLSELEKRKNIVLKPRRTLKPNNNIYFADYISGVGNETTFSTYPDVGKNIFPIPLSTTTIFQSPENKKFNEIRKNFVWIGGGGAVHKGLDLLLEIFAKMPEYSLTILGPVEAEDDFVNLYKEELYNTKNIKILGRISPKSKIFKDTLSSSIALIYPSSSEGQAGSVITAMHAGLIPIISKNSGVSVEKFGILLEDCSKEEIKKQIIKISSMSTDELSNRALDTWNAAQKYTLKTFNKAYKTFLEKIINQQS